MKQHVTGASEVANVFNSLAPREARNLMRATVGGVASRISRRAKGLVARATNRLKKAIFVRRHRMRGDRVSASVAVRLGARGAARGAFYWRFVEYGAKDLPARPFLTPAAEEVRAELPQIVDEEMKKALVRQVNRALKKARNAHR